MSSSTMMMMMKKKKKKINHRYVANLSTEQERGIEREGERSWKVWERGGALLNQAFGIFFSSPLSSSSSSLLLLLLLLPSSSSFLSIFHVFRLIDLVVCVCHIARV